VINNMRVRILFTLLASLGLLFVMLPAAQANPVQLYFTGATTSSNNGVGTDPYQFKISNIGANATTGAIVWLNCDDFPDHITPGESWVANVINGGNTASLVQSLMSTHNGWNDGTAAGATLAEQAYDAKAWLELHYTGAANNPDYSYAIWMLFDQSLVDPNHPANRNDNPVYAAAEGAMLLDWAGGYNTYRQQLTIYTPDLNCKLANACGSLTTGWTEGVPQEVDTVPDGGVTLMLLGGALVGLETLRRKFRV
jgi:hypothetical protein